MTISPGSRLGPYDVQSLIGAGGMGEVYRARDTRLGRDVAIKVLPADVAGDRLRLRRFEQEARATAALNHPNIVSVHDIGTEGSTTYVVSELLQGQTLREALAGGALPMRKAIEYAVQIATGLAAAHEKGIVHRDLKPENIFITSDGRAKILDFGLAKVGAGTAGTAGENGTATIDASPTRTFAGTDAGTVLGTVGYMSPEQVRGQSVDHHSDIFSFGAVLYEMLTGARVFARVTAADTLSAILNVDPPDLATSERSIPPTLARIVSRCLEKSPAARFHSAGDLAFALTNLSSSPSGSGVVVPDRPRTGTRTLTWAFGAVALAASVLAAWALRPRTATPEQAVVRFEIPSPPGTFFGDAPQSPSQTLSADGQYVAFSAGPLDGTKGSIWVRRIDALGSIDSRNN